MQQCDSDQVPEAPQQAPSDFALAFDGSDDVVLVEDSTQTLDLDDFTIEAWVYRFEFNSHGTIVMKGGHGENPLVNTNYAIAILPSNVARTIWEDANSQNYDVRGSTVIEPDRWYHIACVRSAAENSLALYVNGVLDTTMLQTTGKPNTQDMPVRFGFNGTGFAQDDHLKGLIDEVRIWNVPRTQQQIQETMHVKLRGDEPGLVGYWSLDDGAGQVVHDLTGNGNHGHLGYSEALEPSDPIWVVSSAPVRAAEP